MIRSLGFWTVTMLYYLEYITCIIHGHVVIHINMFFPAYKTVLDQPNKYSFSEIWAEEATFIILLLSDFNAKLIWLTHYSACNALLVVKLIQAFQIWSSCQI